MPRATAWTKETSVSSGNEVNTALTEEPQMDVPIGSLFFRLVAVLALVAANGMFVAAEFAIVSVRRARLLPLAEGGSQAAKLVLRAARDPNAFLAATQLGITIASLGLGWIGEPALATLLEPWLRALPIGIRATTAHLAAVVIAFSIITALHIIFGELAAKSAALWRPEGTALIVAPPTELFHQLFRPVIWILNTTANGVLGLFGLRAPSGHHVHSPEEISTLVTESQQAGAIEEKEATFVHRVFRFTDRIAEEVMVPRVSVRGLPKTSTVRDCITVTRDVGFTRFPVFDESVDRIIAMVHAKDLLIALADGRGEDGVETIMRPVLYVPETKAVVDLLDEMRRGGTQLAVVIDEFGGTAGIVTLEDLLEELVGEIPGEFRKERPLVIAQRPDRLVVDAAIPLDELNRTLRADFPTDDANTLGGFIFRALGSVPSAGTTFQHDRFELRIESVSANRIGLVQIRRIDAPQS
jgi:CBS domain containing-hemolysin-like protein